MKVVINNYRIVITIELELSGHYSDKKGVEMY